MKVCIGSLILILLNLIFAQEGAYVSGVLTEDTQWQGLVYVNGDITVPRGVTLTIAPATRVLMKTKMDKERSGIQPERIEFNVLGRLIADAYNSSAPIVFTSESKQQQMHDWYGIIFKPSSSHSLLRNCVVEYGYIAVSCYGASPKMEDSIFRYNYLAGISCEVQANPVIKNSLLLDNGYAGINCELSSNPVVLNCIIAQNSNGVVVYDRSRPDLGRINPQAGQSPGENRIFNNFDYEVYNRSKHDIFAQNNFWKSNKAEEIRGKLYDHTNMSQYGEVIFEPFREQSFATFTSLSSHIVKSQPYPLEETDISRRSAAPGSTTLSNPDEASNDSGVVQHTATLLPVSPDSGFRYNPPDGQTLAGDSAANSSNPLGGASATGNQTELPVETPGKTGFTSDNQTPAAVASDHVQPQAPSETLPLNISSASGIREPVIESFLDAGQRQYIKRESPPYPADYRKVGTEGIVLMEVVVGQDGRIQSYRTLRSDGKAFTEAAIAALENIRYKAGTINGQPVMFKAIERFIFKPD